MTIRKTSVGLASLCLLVAGALPLTAAADDKTMELKLRFAGAFATAVLREEGPISTTPVSSPLIQTKFISNLGNGVTTGFGARNDLSPPPSFPTSCLGLDGDPFDLLRVLPTQDPLVSTFDDLSLLFATGSGEICIKQSTGESEFRIDITFIGGRGRFEGAMGVAVIEGEAQSLTLDGSFSGETGTITGWITVPDDHDDHHDEDHHD